MQWMHAGMHACKGLPPSHTAGRPIPQGGEPHLPSTVPISLSMSTPPLPSFSATRMVGLPSAATAATAGAGKSIGRAGSGGGGESQAAAAAANHNPSRGGPPLRPSCSHNCCQDVGRAPAAAAPCSCVRLEAAARDARRCARPVPTTCTSGADGTGVRDAGAAAGSADLRPGSSGAPGRP